MDAAGGALRLGLLPLVVLAAPVGPAWPQEPWRLTAGAAPQDEQFKRKYEHDRYWYIFYDKALDLLDGPSPNTDEIIYLLKMAVSKDARSGASKATFSPQERVDYFPYYHLALAFEKQIGKADLAWECLQEERRQGAILGHAALRVKFAATEERVRAAAEARELVARANEALRWGEGEAGVVSPAGRSLLDEIRSLKARVEQPGSPDVKADPDHLISKLVEFSRRELQDHETLCSQLGAEPWVGAFPSPQDRLKTDACMAPASEQRTLTWATSALKALESCDTHVVDAMRTAGDWGCSGVKKTQGDIKAAEDLVRQFGGTAGAGGKSSGPLPGLKASSCLASWHNASSVEVARTFAALTEDRARVWPLLEARKRDGEQALRVRSKEIRDATKTVRARIPEISSRCAQDLELVDVVSRLGELREMLNTDMVPETSPPLAGWLTAESRLDELLSELYRRIDGGVDTALGLGSRLPGASPSSLEDVSPARETYRRTRQAADLEALCGRVAVALRDIARRVAESFESIKQEGGRYLTLLLEARGAAAPDGPGACLGQRVEDLRRLVASTRTAAGEQVGRGLSILTGARSCLEEFSRDTEMMFTKVSTSVAGIVSLVTGADKLKGKSGELARLAEKVERVRRDVMRFDALLTRTAELYPGTGQPVMDGGRLRSILADAGVPAGVSQEAWELLDEGRGSGEALAADAWKTIRDAALLPELIRAGRVAEGSEPLIVEVGPIVVLNEAFSAFFAGRIDEAILLIRTAHSQHRLPAEGRAAAVGHAALSYFLHTKRLALEHDEAVEAARQHLQADAEREARAAVRTDRRLLELPNLFRSDSFRAFFAACAQGAS